MLRFFVLVIVSVVSWPIFIAGKRPPAPPPETSPTAVSKAAAASQAPRTGVVTLPSGVQVRYVERGAEDPSRVDDHAPRLHGFVVFIPVADGSARSHDPGDCHRSARPRRFQQAGLLLRAAGFRRRRGRVHGCAADQDRHDCRPLDGRRDRAARRHPVARARVRAGDRRLVAELRQSGGRRAARRGQGAERSDRSEIRARVPGEHDATSRSAPSSSIATSTRA